jgi:hypothetical protein
MVLYLLPAARILLIGTALLMCVRLQDRLRAASSARASRTLMKTSLATISIGALLLEPIEQAVFA